MITARNYRLMNDPVFRTLSDAMYVGMKAGKFTPTDIREALLCASLRIERDRPPDFTILESARARESRWSVLAADIQRSGKANREEDEG